MNLHFYISGDILICLSTMGFARVGDWNQRQRYVLRTFVVDLSHSRSHEVWLRDGSVMTMIFTTRTGLLKALVQMDCPEAIAVCRGDKIDALLQ